MKGKFNFKIGVIVAVAFVAGIVGTLSFANFDTPTENVTPQSNPTDQNVGIGAYVIVEAYHEDGTLYQKFEGHNDLSTSARNAIVACATAIDTAPANFQSCDTWNNAFQLSGSYHSNQTTVLPRPVQSVTSVVLLPLVCDTQSTTASGDCDGWEITGTFDFDELSDINSFNATQIFSGKFDGNFRAFNIIDLIGDDQISINPMDRLFVNMTFSVNP